MLIKLHTLIFILTLIFVQPAVLMAQNSNVEQDWSAVRAVPVGSKLRIETKSGKRSEGNLIEVTDSTLTLTSKGKTTQFTQTDIYKIYTVKSGSRAKSVLIGIGVGAGIGGGISAIGLGATGGSDETSSIIGRGIAIGAGVGAALGAIVGKGNKRIPIYESK